MGGNSPNLVTRLAGIIFIPAKFSQNENVRSYICFG
jgi:hypothetical protein